MAYPARCRVAILVRLEPLHYYASNGLPRCVAYRVFCRGHRSHAKRGLRLQQLFLGVHYLTFPRRFSSQSRPSCLMRMLSPSASHAEASMNSSSSFTSLLQSTMEGKRTCYGWLKRICLTSYHVPSTKDCTLGARSNRGIIIAPSVRATTGSSLPPSSSATKDVGRLFMASSSQNVV